MADVSFEWGRRAAIGALELRPSGAGQQPATTKTITWKEERS
nr:MAG TPA: hypothetical protein [Caudoviricetes sp.]